MGSLVTVDSADIAVALLMKHPVLWPKRRVAVTKLPLKSP